MLPTLQNNHRKQRTPHIVWFIYNPCPIPFEISNNLPVFYNFHGVRSRINMTEAHRGNEWLSVTRNRWRNNSPIGGNTIKVFIWGRSSLIGAATVTWYACLGKVGHGHGPKLDIVPSRLRVWWYVYTREAVGGGGSWVSIRMVEYFELGFEKGQVYMSQCWFRSSCHMCAHAKFY